MVGRFWCMVDGLWSMVGWLRLMVGLGLRVVRRALIGHLGDVAVDVIGGVVNVLGAAVRQGHGVGAGDGAVLVGGLVGLVGGV